MSRRPLNRRSRLVDELRGQLLRGGHVELDVRLRRTSARGWGPWTDSIVNIGPLPDGAVSWHVEDPVAVGLPSTRGPVDADFLAIDRVTMRPVRFRTEAFWGMESDIVVLHSERTTSELAVPPLLTEPLFDRLRDQLVGRTEA
jgi:hypothetical protein